MSNLVIIESPGKESAIKGYLGSGYKVMAAIGHIRDLPKSSLGVDIENNFAAHYINIRGKGEIIKELRKEAKSAKNIYLATDPDREGEAISWHLATVLGIPLDKPCRVTFNEITKSAVTDAVKHPRPINMDLVNSQQTRRILDRIVGYKLSPFLWKSVRSGLSAGRVQSVAARIIVEREREINAFVPEEYWTVEANMQTAGGETFISRYYGSAGKRNVPKNEAEAYSVVKETEGKSFEVASVKKARKVRQSAPPFTTSTLQQEAFKKLGFASARIMRVAQELYEGVNIGPKFGGTHGLITYMRTDSLRVSAEAQSSAADYITKKYGDDYRPEKPPVYKTGKNMQDAHEAIRPSDVSIEPSLVRKSLSPDQYRLYKLIWERFVASQMAGAVYNTVNAEFKCGEHIFKATGSTLVFQGFLALYEESAEEPQKGQLSKEQELVTNLPELVQGAVVGANKVTPYQHFTEAPPRFNEASLIKFLEEKGIGRPSTYTPIITTIIARGYVKKDGKYLKPTPLGEITTGIMEKSFAEIVDYEFTANMETKLDRIEEGEDTLEKVLSGFYAPFEKQLEKAEKTVKKEEIEIPDEETDIICELCGKRMVIKNGRFGKFAACPGYPECKNTKRLDRNGKPVEKEEKKVVTADFKCELCGGEVVLRSGRYGSFYACANYPKCKFTRQIAKETGALCPKCGGKVLLKNGKNKAVFYSCENYPKCDFSSWDAPTSEKCPVCGKMLFEKKNKKLLVCHDAACGYSRAVTDDLQREKSENE